MTSLAILRRTGMGIYESRTLRGRIGAREVLVVGSGGVEKNIKKAMHGKI